MPALLGVGARRRIARLGIAAVLFQALLFGWHHHPLPLPLPLRGIGAAVHAAGGAPLAPVSADDDCDICAALHHLAGAPGAFTALPQPEVAAAVIRPPAARPQEQADHRAFQARAPPRA